MDLNHFNPDWQFAQNHGKSTLPGTPIHQKQDDIEQHLLCDCCLNSIEKQQIPLCQNSKELQFLGFGFPLYFIFVKYAMILLILLMVSYTSVVIIWATEDNQTWCIENHPLHQDHSDIYCTSWMIYVAALEGSLTRYEVVVRIASFIIQLLTLIYIRDKIRKTYEYYDQRRTTLSDYSLLIQNLPEIPGIQAKIRELFSKKFKKPHQIHNIIVLNEIDEFYHLENCLKNSIDKKMDLLNDQTKNKQAIQKVNTQIQTLQKDINDLYYQQQKKIKEDQAITDKIIVILDSQPDKYQVLEEFDDFNQEQLSKFFGEDSKIKISMQDAPEPKQIIWQNINYPYKKKIGRVLLGWSLSFLFLTVVTVIFFFILQEKGLALEHAIEKQHQDPHESSNLMTEVAAIAYIVILMIIFFNKFVLSTVLHIFTDLQKHSSGGDFEFSFGLKYTLGLFFTTALMTLLVEDIRFHNIYYHNYGVIEQETIMFFMNAFLVPFIWFVNPWYLIKVLKRKFYFGKKNLTQKMANELMEETKYSMGKKYAEIVESLWFTYLYASIIPLGSFLIFIGLSLFYWVDKYNLLRKCSVGQNVEGSLCIKYLFLLECTLILKPIGQIIFDPQLRDTWSAQTVACICVAFVYLILPINTILDFVHEQKFELEQKKYGEVKQSFLLNYQTLHPLFVKERREIIKSMTVVNKVFNFSQALIHKNHKQDTSVNNLYAEQKIHNQFAVVSASIQQIHKIKQ